MTTSPIYEPIAAIHDDYFLGTIRMERGMTQAALAKAVGVPQPTIAAPEAGELDDDYAQGIGLPEIGGG